MKKDQERKKGGRNGGRERKERRENEMVNQSVSH